MQDAFIVDAVRTPFGAHEGVFSETHPQDLGTVPLLALEERNGFVPEEDVDDVFYGVVNPVDEQAKTVGRLVSLLSGWGDSVPGIQLDRMCGSGQQAVNSCAAEVRAGFADVLIGGGLEHMTRVPMGSNGSWSDVSDTYYEHFDEMTTQGEAAERIAEQGGYDRRELDQIAVDSQQRWAEARDAGYYDDQVVPVETSSDDGVVRVSTDEHPRPETDLETLADLPLAFRDEGNGVIHAGNASGIVDGSAAVLVASGEACEAHGWDPMARIVDTQSVGVDPVSMLRGPIPATNRLLERNDLSVDDVDRFEVNEAFASVVTAWLDETGADWEKTNVWGGAIAHGHPLGATGAALLGKLPYQLEACDGRYGVSTMCIGLGQGIATLIERV